MRKVKSLFNKETGILSSIIVLALALRFWRWPDYIGFDHEKTRDLIASMSIYQNLNITLLGPTTEIDGVYHGPLFYYIIGVFYYITGGHPGAGTLATILFNILGILLIYFIGKDLFSKRVGLIAAFLYAVSFESFSYALWLSNPAFAVPVIFLMFYSFYKFLTSEKKKFSFYLPLALFCYGITIQFQVLHTIFIVPLIILYLFSKKPIPSLKTSLATIAAFLISVSTFIVYELKYGFLMTNHVVNHVLLPFFSKAGGEGPHPSSEYLSRMLDLSKVIFFPVEYWVGAAILIIILGTVIYQFIKTRSFLWIFLFVWIFSTFPIFFIPSRISSGYSAFIGVSGALILVFAFLLNWLFSKNKYIVFVLLGIILAVNVYAVQNFFTNHQMRVFDYFQALFIKTNLELVDYAFDDSAGVQFKTDTVTSPLFISTTWDYLFDWRGRTKFGRVPQREGKPVIGYLILEPYAPVAFKEDAIKKADIEGQLVDTKKFGEVTIQKRLLKY